VPNKGELEAETLINTATAFSSFLKLPAAGSRNQSNGNLNDRSVALKSVAKSTLNWLIKITKKPSQKTGFFVRLNTLSK
jgi:hypothetical protein